MNDALMEKLQDLDLARILPGALAVVGIVGLLIIGRKILRVMLRLGRKRVAGGWASCDPEMDQLFQLASASGQLTHEDVSDDDDALPRGCYVLRLRGRRRERAQALMGTIHSSRNGWRYAPDDAEGQSVLGGPLFSIKV
ncbi:MAG: xanthosine utilization system XapX-like protein [Verrucomicrobiales bacterium]|jgi:xanthosine utilization system XapX-like protein